MSVLLGTRHHWSLNIPSVTEAVERASTLFHLSSFMYCFKVWCLFNYIGHFKKVMLCLFSLFVFCWHLKAGDCNRKTILKIKCLLLGCDSPHLPYYPIETN